MCKKLFKMTLFGGAAAVVVGFLVFGEHFTSYASTAFKDLRAAVKDGVSVDFELRRARELVGKIDPQVLEARREVARAEVDLERLQEELRALQVSIDKGEGKISRLRRWIDENGPSEGLTRVSWEAKVSDVQVKQELARTFDLFRNQKELLDSKAKLMVRQRQVLEAARNKLAAVRSEKQKLEDMITQLEARKRQLDALAATTQQIELDDSSLGQARKVLEEIKRRLDVKEKMIQEGIYLEGIATTEQTDDRDIVGEVERYFGDAEQPAEAPATMIKLETAR